MGVAEQKYIEISLNGHPIDRPHIDTEVQMKIDKSAIVFTPVIITRLQRFINLKVN